MGRGVPIERLPQDIATLGDAVRWARERAGLTLRGLAAKVGVSAPFLSDVEHGRRWPSDLATIAGVLNVSLLDLQHLKLQRSLDDFRRENPELAKVLDELRPKRRCWCPWCRGASGSAVAR